jgi:polyphosphate kinase
VFKHLALGEFVTKSKYLLVAPKQMKQPLIDLIDREIQYAKKGQSAKIVIKTNSLSHRQLIDKLVEASQAGVQVILLVRGICCLQAGIPGISENITIKSIVGRYLEHSRIFSFGEGKRQRIYIGSADWMTRNMDYRVEVAVEILDDAVKKTLNQMLALYLSDNRKLRTMVADGNYLQPERAEGEAIHDSQIELFDYFLRKAQKAQKKQAASKKSAGQKKKGKKLVKEYMKQQYGFLKKSVKGKNKKGKK